MVVVSLGVGSDRPWVAVAVAVAVSVGECGAYRGGYFAPGAHDGDLALVQVRHVHVLRRGSGSGAAGRA